MSEDLIGRINDIIERKSLLEHPFYKAWNRGTLSLESLKEYARQYYHFEAAYPRFLSGVHSRCDDREVRQLLLDNLWDEEHGNENHVELWLRFCDALGLDRNQVISGAPRETTKALVDTYIDMTSRGSLTVGAAALYAFESQVPAVAEAKLKGLREFYGMDDEKDVSFFAVHKTLDEQHSEAEAQMVQALVHSDEDKDAVLQAVDRATDKLWNFLDGVY